MRILLTGISGQIGGALAQTLPRLGTVIGLDRSHLDLTDLASIPEIVRGYTPDFIVHPAAYTAVDRAETEPELCHRINAEACGVLGQTAHSLGIPIVSYSTDYVFDGSGHTPHLEEDPTGPINTYGVSKLAGEHALAESGAQHLILRTAWVYGLTGQNFLKTMLRLAETKSEISVVADQIGTPSESTWIAETTTQLLERYLDHSTNGTQLSLPSGALHLTPRGETSWAAFAKAIFAIQGLTTSVQEIPTEAYPTPAKRPKNSRLDIHRLETLLGAPVPHWHDILEDCLKRNSSESTAP